MYTFANVLPDQYELSRHAAERYALLAAVHQQRVLDRRPRPVVDAVRQPLAIHR